MKLKLILSTFNCLVSLNTYSAPRMFEQIKKMDTDQDGTVTLEEFNANTKSFQLMDKKVMGIFQKMSFWPQSISVLKDGLKF